MPKPLEGPLTKDLLVDETRFLLKTLLRDDLFGDEVSLTEAEKLMEASLTLGFVDYAAFLKKKEYLLIDRTRNTVKVTPRGRLIADGLDDADFHRDLAAHFSVRLGTTSTSLAPLPRSSSSVGMARVATTTTGTPVITGIDDLRDSRYQRQEPLGQGGLGTVYRARHVVLNREVAIKEFRYLFEYLGFLQRDEVLRKLRSSLMAQAALQHPHVLEIHDLNFERDPPWVVMSLATGGNLAGRLERARTAGGPMDINVAARLLLQVGYALQAAHARDLVHGDVRPENILFDGFGNVRVADFGVARAVEKAPGQGPPVYVGVGNPSFLAPEQLHLTAEASTASDVYAFGILMYLVLTGNLPGRRSPMPSEVNAKAPKALDALFDLMTRDRVEDRVRSMDQVLEGLYAAFPREVVLTRGHLVLFEHDPLPPPPPPPPAPPPAPAETQPPSSSDAGPPPALVEPTQS